MAAKVVLDLNNPVFLDEFFSLDKGELVRVVKALKKIRSMDWDTFTKHRGSLGTSRTTLTPTGAGVPARPRIWRTVATVSGSLPGTAAAISCSRPAM